MNQDIYKKIVTECTLFRLAIEECKDSIGIEWFKHFPLGCCMDATLILAKYLHVKGLGIPNVITGWKGNKSHAWLELNGMIIDITADQFEDINERVIVSETSQWHDNYSEDRHSCKYNELLTGKNFGDMALFHAYSIIVQLIERTEVL